MLFVGHLLVAILLFLLARSSLLSYGGNEVILFLILMFAALLPDIDEKHSKMNRWSGALGRLVVKVFKHRGLLHSLLFSGTIALCLGLFVHEAYGLAFLLGYFAHIFADGITPMGVRILYPLPFEVSGPLRVGSIGEKLLTSLLFVVVLVLAIGIYF